MSDPSTDVEQTSVTPIDERRELEVAKIDLATGAPLAVATLKQLASYAKDEKVRYLAACALLEATGLKGKQPSTVGFSFNLPAEYFKKVASGLRNVASGAKSAPQLETDDD